MRIQSVLQNRLNLNRKPSRPYESLVSPAPFLLIHILKYEIGRRPEYRQVQLAKALFSCAAREEFRQQFSFLLTSVLDPSAKGKS